MNPLIFQKRWLVAVACLLGAACATVATRLGAPSGDHIKIPHAQHAEAGLACDACHEKVAAAKSLSAGLLPSMKTCEQCHDVKDEAVCGMCHARVSSQGKQARGERHLNFPHDLHLARSEIGGDCARCHRQLPEPALAGQVAELPMALCTECHNHSDDYDQGRCSKCHQDLTRYSLKPVTDYSHRGDWLKTHSLEARTSVVTCAQCHEQTFCADCHGQTVAARVEVKFPERVDRLFVHRNDYLSRHRMEAGADQARCQRCHGITFCQACHATQGLSPQGATSLDPHPPGYGGPGANLHGADARRDIVRCAACHDQGAASVCVGCHKVGRVGGNPHPGSWLTRHRPDEINGNLMCLACHP